MTSTDLVVQSTAYSRAPLTERQQYVAMLARAGDLLPANLRGGMVRDERSGQMIQMGNLGKTFLLCETGDMLGIHPVAALTGVHIIEGKPSISANLMGGLVRKAGHKLRVKVTGSFETGDLVAVAQLIREDDPDFTFEVTWNIAKAERAQLLPGKANSNWQKYPDAMMKARAISEVIREGAPDVLMGGNVYTPEELGVAVQENGDPIDLQQVPDVPMSQPETPQPTAPAAEPKPQAPIVDEPAPAAPEGEATEAAVDWGQKLANLASKAEATALWAEAREAGALDVEVKIGRKKARPLRLHIEEVGKAFADAEAEAAKVANQEEVVVAEVVDDEPPMALGGEGQQQ